MATELNGYRKSYKLRCAQPGAKTIEVTFPYVVVEREARKRNLSIQQFLERYHVIAEYNNFEGVHYTFKEAEHLTATEPTVDTPLPQTLSP